MDGPAAVLRLDIIFLMFLVLPQVDDNAVGFVWWGFFLDSSVLIVV